MIHDPLAPPPPLETHESLLAGGFEMAGLAAAFLMAVFTILALGYVGWLVFGLPSWTAATHPRTRACAIAKFNPPPTKG